MVPVVEFRIYKEVIKYPYFLAPQKEVLQFSYDGGKTWQNVPTITEVIEPSLKDKGHMYD